MFIALLITLDLFVGCIVSPLWYRRRYRQCYLKGGFANHTWGCGCDSEARRSFQVFDRDGEVIGYKRARLDDQWRGHLVATYSQCAGLLAFWPLGVALAAVFGTLFGAVVAIGWLGKNFGLGVARSTVWITTPVRKGIAAFWKLPLRRMRQQVQDREIIYINGHSAIEPAKVTKIEYSTLDIVTDTNGVDYHYDNDNREWVTEDGMNHMPEKTFR